MQRVGMCLWVIDKVEYYVPNFYLRYLQVECFFFATALRGWSRAECLHLTLPATTGLIDDGLLRSYCAGVLDIRRMRSPPFEDPQCESPTFGSRTSEISGWPNVRPHLTSWSSAAETAAERAHCSTL